MNCYECSSKVLSPKTCKECKQVFCDDHIEQLLTKYELWQPTSFRPWYCATHMRKWFRDNYGSTWPQHFYQGKFGLTPSQTARD